MKFTIVYEYDSGTEHKFWAKTTLDHAPHVVLGSGNSFQEAEAQLIARLRKTMKDASEVVVPQPKEIEL